MVKTGGGGAREIFYIVHPPRGDGQEAFQAGVETRNREVSGNSELFWRGVGAKGSQRVMLCCGFVCSVQLNVGGYS